MNMTIADFILHRLKQLGCRHVFGIPGTSCAGVFEAIDRTEGIDYVLTTNELEAGYLADGYGRQGVIGAACVSYGVGTLSLANAVASALTERAPMIILNGGPTDNDLRIEEDFGVLFSHSTGRRDTDLKVFKELCLDARRLTVLDEMEAEIDQLFTAAVSGCGPVYLETPQDYWTKSIPVQNAEFPQIVRPPSEGLEEFLTRLRERLDAATRPVLLLGSEISRKGLAHDVEMVIDLLQIPFATTLLSKSVISEDHDLFGGVYDSDLAPKSVRTLVEDADLVVSLGCVFGIDHRVMVKKQFSNMLEVGFGRARAGNVRFESLQLEDVLTELKGFPQADSLNRRLAEGSFQQRRVCVKSPSIPPDCFGHEMIFECVDEFLAKTEEEIFVGLDTCLASYPGADLPRPQSDSYLCNPVWLSIGQGTPATAGAWFATGKRPLIVTGDGGFQMVASAISTMVVNKIPAIVIVIDNGTYAIEQFLIDGKYFTDPSHDPLKYVNLNAWRYEQLPSIFNGGKGYSVSTGDELTAALGAALDVRDAPVVISCAVSDRDLPNENWTFLEEYS